MKKKIRLATVVLSGTMVAAAFGGGAVFAADATSFGLPAVSGPNGKLEIGGGYADLEDFGDDTLIYGGASFSLPVGDAFGFQGDLAVTDTFGSTLVGGAAHFFTRDPDAYLVGIVGGAGFSDNANLFFVGPEVELYAGNFTLEAWGGYMNLDVDGFDSSDELFAQVDLALYATDNLRFSVGASSVAGFTSGNLAMEWLIATGLPLALTAKGEIGDDEYMSISAGLKVYFGGDDSKTLIRRHREDDPRNRGLDAFGAGGSAYTNKDGGGKPGGGGEEGGGCGEEGQPFCYGD